MKDQRDKIQERKGKILVHIKTERYPDFSREEKHAIRVIAESLYKNVQLEADKSLELYRQIDKAFVRG